jgi:hypothetical protein
LCISSIPVGNDTSNAERLSVIDCVITIESTRAIDIDWFVIPIAACSPPVIDPYFDPPVYNYGLNSLLGVCDLLIFFVTGLSTLGNFVVLFCSLSLLVYEFKNIS